MATNLNEAVLEQSQRLLPDMIAWRRHLHQNPELAMQEFETSAFVQKVLHQLGIEVLAGPQHTGTPTGVVGILRGGGQPADGYEKGRVVAIRADMDALPISEQTGLPFASQNPGVMHACGHDGHTAILLGTAAQLARQRESLPGTVKFLFQPAEETIGGAEPMVKAGVLHNPEVDIVLALHVNTSHPTGQINVQYGVSSAAVDTARITILGRSAHGAWPHRGIDAIHVASQAVVALQAIASRQTSALDPVVLTIGTIQGGTASNILAAEVTMDATIRTLRPDTRESMPDRIQQVLAGVCAAYGADFRLELTPGYPSVVNDSAVTKLVERAAVKVTGRQRVAERENLGMGAEDFSYFAAEVPGCMFYLGTRNEAQGITALAHTPEFNIDEEAMAYGSAVFIQAVHDYLNYGLPTD